MCWYLVPLAATSWPPQWVTWVSLTFSREAWRPPWCAADRLLGEGSRMSLFCLASSTRFYLGRQPPCNHTCHLDFDFDVFLGWLCCLSVSFSCNFWCTDKRETGWACSWDLSTTCRTSYTTATCTGSATGSSTKGTFRTSDEGNRCYERGAVDLHRVPKASDRHIMLYVCHFLVPPPVWQRLRPVQKYLRVSTDSMRQLKVHVCQANVELAGTWCCMMRMTKMVRVGYTLRNPGFWANAWIPWSNTEYLR